MKFLHNYKHIEQCYNISYYSDFIVPAQHHFDAIVLQVFKIPKLYQRHVKWLMLDGLHSRYYNVYCQGWGLFFSLFTKWNTEYDTFFKVYKPYYKLQFDTPNFFSPLFILDLICYKINPVFFPSVHKRLKKQKKNKIRKMTIKYVPKKQQYKLGQKLIYKFLKKINLKPYSVSLFYLLVKLFFHPTDNPLIKQKNAFYNFIIQSRRFD